jgi:hypothetical protein
MRSMLYKYVTASRAMTILRTQRIRFTQPSEFNDPFELHPEFQLMSRDDIAELPPSIDEDGNEIPGIRQLTPEAILRMLDAVAPHVERMSPIYGQYPGAAFAIDNNAVGQDYYDRNFGILSLTEVPDSLLMWAHYGEEHRGVILGFDENHAFFNGAEIVAGLSRLSKVEYNQRRPVLSVTTRDNPKVFLRKSTDWSHEKEWRFIRPLSEAADVKQSEGKLPLCLFELPHDAIQMMITGARMLPQQYEEICDFGSETSTMAHVEIHHSQLSKERYEVEVHPALTADEQQSRLQGKVMSAKPFDI